MPRASGNDIVEIFGYAPDDITPAARSFWGLNICPFTQQPCTKFNHDRSICYGVCSVSYGREEVIICPSRLLAANAMPLREISNDAFGDIPILRYEEYIDAERREEFPEECIVLLGKGSGKEIKFGSQKSLMSLDWVLAKVENGALVEFTAAELQSIDITNNYRETWNAYNRLPTERAVSIPSSSHGLNWANVHKRLIPQLIRKGQALRECPRFAHGLFFVVPEVVFNRFEVILGNCQQVDCTGNDILTIYTYGLGEPVPYGNTREIERIRRINIELDEFALSFISRLESISHEEIQRKIEDALGISSGTLGQK